MNQRIAFVPANTLTALPIPHQGFVPDPDRTLYDTLRRHLAFGERAPLEEDSSKKQIIPYVLIQRDDTVWTMVRTAQSQESRLHNKASIGVGGHLEEVDNVSPNEDIIYRGMLRELHEELHIDTQWDEQVTYLGVLNDDTNDVGQVHLGVVFRLNVPSTASVTIQETDKLRGHWRTSAACIDADVTDQDGLQFETWSEIVLNALFG